MNQYNLGLGAIISILLALSVLPTRLAEGQGRNPVNLIGSELVIYAMCLTIWGVCYWIYHRFRSTKFMRAVLWLIVPALLSNMFYWIFNPLFEDYPITPLRELPFWFATLRLCNRGLLIGLFSIPIILVIEKQRQIQRGELDRERQRVRESEERKVLLEQLVSDRTRELEETLTVLSESQDKLDHQFYLVSRLVASIAHDVNAPLKYTVSITDEASKLIDEGQYAGAREHIGQLGRSLMNMSVFLGNLLAFSKTQIRSESLHISKVNLADVVWEKVALFDGIIHSKGNSMKTNIGEKRVPTNQNLLSIILHNLLDNATKNTENGIITIETEEVQSQLHLLVKNTVWQVQKPAADQELDVSPGRQATGSINENGFGLILIRDICSLLNIGFEIRLAGDEMIARLIFSQYSNGMLMS